MQDVQYWYYTYSLKFQDDKTGIAITFTPCGKCDCAQQLVMSLAVDSINIACRFGGTMLSMSFDSIKSLIWLPKTIATTIFVKFEDDWDRMLFIDELKAVGIF